MVDLVTGGDIALGLADDAAGLGLEHGGTEPTPPSGVIPLADLGILSGFIALPSVGGAMA